MATVKYAEAVHVRGCFSAKRVSPQNTAMNKDWSQNILREQLLPTFQEQFGEERCLVQHDGVPGCEAKGSGTKQQCWVHGQETSLTTEDTWPILKRQEDTHTQTHSDKLQVLIMTEGAALSQGSARELIDSMWGDVERSNTEWTLYVTVMEMSLKAFDTYNVCVIILQDATETSDKNSEHQYSCHSRDIWP